MTPDLAAAQNAAQHTPPTAFTTLNFAAAPANGQPPARLALEVPAANAGSTLAAARALAAVEPAIRLLEDWLAAGLDLRPEAAAPARGARLAGSWTAPLDTQVPVRALAFELPIAAGLRPPPTALRAAARFEPLVCDLVLARHALPAHARGDLGVGAMLVLPGSFADAWRVDARLAGATGAHAGPAAYLRLDFGARRLALEPPLPLAAAPASDDGGGIVEVVLEQELVLPPAAWFGWDADAAIFELPAGVLRARALGGTAWSARGELVPLGRGVGLLLREFWSGARHDEAPWI